MIRIGDYFRPEFKNKYLFPTDQLYKELKINRTTDIEEENIFTA